MEIKKNQNKCILRSTDKVYIHVDLFMIYLHQNDNLVALVFEDMQTFEITYKNKVDKDTYDNNKAIRCYKIPTLSILVF